MVCIYYRISYGMVSIPPVLYHVCVCVCVCLFNRHPLTSSLYCTVLGRAGTGILSLVVASFSTICCITAMLARRLGNVFF